MAILVSKVLAAQADAIHTVEIVPARVLRVTFTRGDSDRLDLVNVRTAITADFLDRARLRQRTRAPRLLCGGDFNFDATLSEVTHITAAGRAHNHTRTRDRARWPRS